MFGKNFQRKYALTDQGVRNTKKGAFWTVIVNLIVMAGIGILYFMTACSGSAQGGPGRFQHFCPRRPDIQTAAVLQTEKGM